MNENLPTNVQFDTNQNGSVTFASDVVATIAGLAATEVEGVASMSGSTGLADILSRKPQTRSLTRGVKVEIDPERTVSVDVTIVIEFGSPVPEVAYNIQENVKKAIETMSGMTVTSVDVHVQGVSFDRENKTTAEIEMQQRKLLNREQQSPAQAESAGAQTGPATSAEAPASAQPQEVDEDDFTMDMGDEDEENLEQIEPEDAEDQELPD